MRLLKGKIIKTKKGFFVQSIVLFVMKEFDVDPAAQITLSDKWDWCHHVCCICGISENTYRPQAEVTIEGAHYPVCDKCLKAECPELFLELGKRRVEFDAKLEAEEKSRDKKDKETDEVKADDDDGIPF